MYSDRARQLRQCQATLASGAPCKRFACWGATVCGSHGGRKRGKAPTCRCAAYEWPHRPGGGLCRWPDAPEYRRMTRAGTHTRRRRTRFRGLVELMAAVGPGMPPHLADYWADRLGDGDDEDEDDDWLDDWEDDL